MNFIENIVNYVNHYGIYFYYLYMSVVALFLVNLIVSAGMSYVAIMAGSILIFSFIQYPGKNRVLVNILRCIIAASVGVVCFMKTFPINNSPLLISFIGSFSGDMGLMILGFAVLGTLSNKSIFLEDTVNEFKNFVVIALMLLCAYMIFNTLLFPLKMLIITDKLSLLIVYFIQWSLPLALMFVFNHIVGRSPEALSGFKVLSVKEFIMHFLLGIMVVSLSDAISIIILPLFFSHEVLLMGLNIVSWNPATYFYYQSITVVCVLIQTLVEEISFRSMLHGVLLACGFGEGVSNGRSQFQYVFEVVIMSFLMSAWFAAAHLANPVENGRAFGSILEKFVLYLKHVSFSTAYLLTGNIALSWGMHFMHNYLIFMKRFSFSATNNGFFQKNIYQSTASSTEIMQKSIAEMAVDVMLVVGAHYYAEHVKNRSKSEVSPE